ncbi:MAG: sulfatase-like hydrolase/transferase [Alcanivorax sp.]|nr:sulfatase-like hydrolase/transferase [Alcanivorax sp.]
MLNNDSRERLPLQAFYAVNFLLLFVILGYIARGSLTANPLAGQAFLLAAMAGYAFTYLLPVGLLGLLVGRLLGPLAKSIWAVAMTSVLLLLLLTDSQIYGMYGFHFNGFVWNLMTTPGGIASMGGGDAANLTVALVCITVVALEAALVWGLRGRRLPGWRNVLVLVVLCMVAERVAYGVSHLQGYRPVLVAAQEIPFYQPTTFRSIAKRLGIEIPRQARLAADHSGRLHYPLAPLKVAADAPSPNIVFLVCESLRWDMLTPEIMPNLWRFASQHGQRFTQHYSGGNGTRMGIFSLFYGLPGNYWFSFLDERRPPVFITELQRRGYHLGLFTSAKFSYPEFDKTVFASVPSDQLVSDDQGEGWKSDRRNVGRLLDFIDRQTPANPYFGFMFFESSHARYYFPRDSVIRKDYLPDLNYATMDLQRDMPGIFNRYVNASHHLDQQLGRVLNRLEQSGALANTLVVVTGDHGEEFMEHGRWGHNSEFHNEQMHTPLVLAVPGEKPGVFDYPTSHLDLMPTLLPRLGVSNPVGDYALGRNLHQPAPDRYRLVASWNSVAYVGPDYKVAMPLKAGGLSEMTVSTAADAPVADSAAVVARLQSRLVGVLNDLSRFFRKN